MEPAEIKVSQQKRYSRTLPCYALSPTGKAEAHVKRLLVTFRRIPNKTAVFALPALFRHKQLFILHLCIHNHS